MQIQTGPTIPIKPLHHSGTDNELNSEKVGGVQTTLNAHKDDSKKHSINSLPRQQQNTTTTPSHNKPSYQANRQPATNGKTVYKSPRRPKGTLTIHHLYLYSSSSPDNLLSNNDNHQKSYPMPGHSNGSRAYGNSSIFSQAQTNGAAGIPSSTTSYLNNSTKMNPGAGFKSSHSNQWHPEASGIQHTPVNSNSPGVSKFQPMHTHKSSGVSPAPPFHMNSSSPSAYPAQNRTNTTANNNNLDGMIAQLMEMGFDEADVKHTIASSKNHTIEHYLDILVQKASNSDQPQQPRQQQNQETSVPLFYHQQTNTAFGSTSFTKSQTPAPPKPTSTSKSWQERSNSTSPLSPKTDPRHCTRQSCGNGNLDNDSSDDDEYLSKDIEWKRQQEARQRHYAESLKKQQQHQDPPRTSSYTKPFPTTPASPPQAYQYTKPSFNPSPTVQPPSTPSSTTPPPSRPMSSSGAPVSRPVDPDTIKKAIKARTRGNDLFKLGYYREAEKSYNQALALLPDRHDVTAVISNNRAAARLKNGQYRQCVMDCTLVIDWARQKYTTDGKAATIELDGGIFIRWYDQLSKALHRKAEALEKMARTTDAQVIYQELINMDSGDSKAQAGLERCQSATETKPAPPPPPFSKSASTYTPSTSTTHDTKTSTTTASTTAFPGLDYSIFETQQPSKAVAAMRARQAAQAKEETERLEKADMVNARIDSWKHGKENNIRALLSSLDTLLWPGAQWRGAPVNELLEPRKVKVCYMKAIAKVHPDKLPPTSTVEQRLLASGIFSVLNQAWDDFRSKNNLV